MKQPIQIPGLAYMVLSLLVCIACFLLFLFIGSRAATRLARWFDDGFDI